MVYNLEYELLDSIGRAKKSAHYAVLSSVEQVEDAKQILLKQYGENIKFNVYPIEDLFARVSQS